VSGQAARFGVKVFCFFFSKKKRLLAYFKKPGETIMGKGDKQHGSREAKKPKADKKAAPASASFLKPQADARKPGGKPASK
jgi:hypothetical protein